MSILVIRHGLSEANNINNFGTPAFGNFDAPLMEQGRASARRLRRVLPLNYGINLSSTPAATSELLRTQQTAKLAGFKTLQSYTLLNEVDRGLSLEDKRAVKATGVIPKEAIDAANDLLNDPPEEQIWFTHGLLIAGLCKVLNIYQDTGHRTIPSFCEIRRLPL